jgi:DNA-binding LacI/PurR family transcriptional regulator
MIEAGGLREGDRLPAEGKLADEFGVSRITLRTALQVLEREGALRRERNVGCVLVKSGLPQVTLMSRTIVLLTDMKPAPDGQVFGGSSDAVSSGVTAGVGRKGLNFLRIGWSELEQDDSLRQLAEARPRGVIVSCWNRPVDWQLNVIRTLTDHGLPVVSYGISAEFDGFDTVSSDHESGTDQLMRFLAASCHRRVLRLWTAPATTGWIEAHDRAYAKAATELGLPQIPATYIEQRIERVEGDESNFRLRMRQMAGYLAEHMQGPGAVDAVMVGTDSEAMTALAACRLFGLQDVAVVGYDNYWQTSPERQWEPGKVMATVEKNNHRLGEELVGLLLQRIDGALPPVPQKRLVPQLLVVSS